MAEQHVVTTPENTFKLFEDTVKSFVEYKQKARLLNAHLENLRDQGDPSEEVKLGFESCLKALRFEISDFSEGGHLTDRLVHHLERLEIVIYRRNTGRESGYVGSECLSNPLSGVQDQTPHTYSQTENVNLFPKGNVDDTEC